MNKSVNNKRNIRKQDINKKILNYLGYPFNREPFYQIFLSNFILIALFSKDINDIFRHILLIGNGLYLVCLLKSKYKTLRPNTCQELNIDYCPKTYDIPSGHSFISVYWLIVLLILKKKYTLPLIVYLGIVPFSRIFLGVHTIKAVSLGTLLGCFWGVLWFFLK